MLIAVLVLTVVGMVLMGVAIVTANTILALLVIGLAAVGLGLLLRDWLRDRRGRGGGPKDAAAAESDEQDAAGHETPGLEPDLFEPDVSYEDAVAEEHQGTAGEKKGE